jgi:hypothetical protein
MARGKDKIMVSGGVGPSKLHGGSDDGPDTRRIERLRKCHINGVAIPDLHLLDDILRALDYAATDEGVAESNARPNVREASGVSLGKDGFDKALEERRDDVKLREKPLFDSRDPLKELADRHAVPGMRAKFLSANRLKERGGTGDYQIVKDKDGNDVKVRGMVLAHIPEEVAAARTEHYRDRGNQILKQIGETYKSEGGGTAVVDVDNR